MKKALKLFSEQNFSRRRRKIHIKLAKLWALQNYLFVNSLNMTLLQKWSGKQAALNIQFFLYLRTFLLVCLKDALSFILQIHPLSRTYGYGNAVASDQPPCFLLFLFDCLCVCLLLSVNVWKPVATEMLQQASKQAASVVGCLFVYLFVCLFVCLLLSVYVANMWKPVATEMLQQASSLGGGLTHFAIS